MTTRQPLTIIQLAKRCKEIYLAAEKDLGPSVRDSVLDLVADNIEDASLEDLKTALVVAGLR